MAGDKSKYKIAHFMSLQPQYWTIEKMITELEKHGITARTFYRDRSIKQNEERDITGERLLIYSKIFDCPITHLYNYDKAIKPLRERKLSEDMKRMMEKTNLKMPS